MTSRENDVELENLRFGDPKQYRVLGLVLSLQTTSQNVTIPFATAR